MFKIDMHIHTLLGGDSAITPLEVVPCALWAGLDGVCITEHHDYGLSAPFDEIARKTGFPIFRAMEYRAAEGHLLIYGLPVGKSDLMPGLPIQYAIDWVDRQGGVAICAHPYQTSLSGQCLGQRVFELNHMVALETFNASATLQENQQAQAAAKKLNLAGIGGSDAHGPRAIGRAYTLFPHPIHTLEELVCALKSRQYETHPK
jgi:hypothetical protein